jgi:hypothetical protein
MAISPCGYSFDFRDSLYHFTLLDECIGQIGARFCATGEPGFLYPATTKLITIKHAFEVFIVGMA